MKISLVDPYLAYHPDEAHTVALGGTETSFVHLAEALAARGHDVRVHLQDPGLERYREVTYCRWGETPPQPCDVLAVRWPELLEGWRGAAAARVWWCHRPIDGASVAEARRQRAYPVLTSRYQAEELAGHRWEWGFDVVPLGCRFLDIPPPEIPREPFTALWASAMDRGLERFLGIWREIRPRLPAGSRLKVAGGSLLYREYGRYLEPIEKRLREETRGEPDIIWLGPLAPLPLWRELHACGFLPYCATAAESFCLLVLEAQAAGCLPMVTPLGALRERVAHGKTGWVEAPEAFGMRILAYAGAAGGPEVEAMRAAARLSAGKFTWRESARRFEAALVKAREAASLPRSGSPP